jgi:hypothetical protein
MYPNANYRKYGAGPPVRDFQFSISSSVPHISGHNWPVSNSSIASDQTIFWVLFERNAQFTGRKDIGCQAISPIHWALQPCPVPNCHCRLVSDLISWNSSTGGCCFICQKLHQRHWETLRTWVVGACSLVVLPISRQVIMIPSSVITPCAKHSVNARRDTGVAWFLIAGTSNA